MKVTTWLLGKLDRKEIGNGQGDVFFYRYVLLKCRWFSLYLHEFCRSDHDRCLHDHPWSFISVILRGGYFEIMQDELLHWRRPGSILIRSAATAHRIVIEPPNSTSLRPWSLVLIGRKSRAWGFWTRDGWKPWSPGYSPICDDGSEVAL